MPLAHMHNPKSRGKCNIERMIIAYRRPMNLGNLLSHRNSAPTPPPHLSRHTNPMARDIGACVPVCV